MQLQRLPLVGQEAIGIRNPLPMWLVPITIPVNQHIAKTVANFLSVIIRYHWKIPGKVQEKRPCFFVFPSLGWFQQKSWVVGEPPMISNWLSASFCSIMLILAQQSSDAPLFCSPLHLTWCLNEWPFPQPTAVFFQALYSKAPDFAVPATHKTVIKHWHWLRLRVFFKRAERRWIIIGHGVQMRQFPQIPPTSQLLD